MRGIRRRHAIDEGYIVGALLDLPIPCAHCGYLAQVKSSEKVHYRSVADW